MTKEMGSLLPQQGFELPTVTDVIAVTDLGAGNKGSITAADLSPEQRQEIIQDVARPEYRRRSSGSFRCVDGRLPEGGLQPEDSEVADPQGAGGEAVFQPAIDYMVEKGATEPLSQKTARHTRQATAFGRTVTVHGDTHKGKGGCGANVKLREGLRANAENIDIVAPTAWFFAGQLELPDITQDDVTTLILNGKENADNDALWDATPEEVVDIAVANGAKYEELIDEHNEKVIIADVSSGAYSEEQFMKDHTAPDGKVIEAFVASMGAFKELAFADAAKLGQSAREASLRVLGFVLHNIAIPKELTAEEAGNGEALPVVVIK